MLRWLLGLLKNRKQSADISRRTPSSSSGGFSFEPRAFAADLSLESREEFPKASPLAAVSLEETVRRESGNLQQTTPEEDRRILKLLAEAAVAAAAGVPGPPGAGSPGTPGEGTTQGRKREDRMAVATGSGSMRRVVVELMLTLVGVAASSAALYFVMKKLDPNAAQARLSKQKKKEIAERLGRPMIQTNQYEDIIACDVINPEHIDVTFDRIGGLKTVKDNLFELIILPLVRPELFSQGKLLRPQKGVLLYGPPGTGKTMLAKAVAKECGAAFINVRVSSLMSKWFGDAQKLVTAVFTLAHKLQPCIIFIDEIDSILGQRRSTEHEAITSMKTEFMSLWDGFNTDDNARVMVLCATNRPWDLDEAILRRLPRTFEIPLPDTAGRAGILRVILKDECPSPDVDFVAVAAACEGYSGSDLMELCKQAAYYPLRALLDAEEQQKKDQEAAREALPGVELVVEPLTQRSLCTADFLKALASSPPAREAAEEYRRKWDGGRSGAASSPSPSASPSGASADGSSMEPIVRLIAAMLAARGSSVNTNGSLPNGNAHNGT